ncbi:MAG: DUF1816 domain-containing protein [Prochloraceae cyanobacterium]|nr:DUF1816 domain-containing protein [Prochloraceae cyanobacterium]
MLLIERKKSGFVPPNLKIEHQKWWIEIKTAVPRCTYYFGPFDTFEETIEHQGGYVQDLIEEGCFEITLNIKKCRPQTLTIEEF